METINKDNVKSYDLPRVDQNYVIKSQPQAEQIIVQTPNILGPKPGIAVCPVCHQRRETRIEHKAGTKTHLFALGLFATTLCCCCWPYAIESCMNVEHHCDAYLGTYNK